MDPKNRPKKYFLTKGYLAWNIVIWVVLFFLFIGFVVVIASNKALQTWLRGIIIAAVLIVFIIIALFSGLIVDLFTKLLRKIGKSLRNTSWKLKMLRNENIYAEKLPANDARLLGPVNDLYDKNKYPWGAFNQYAIKLKHAFSNSNVENIAIVGNYGVGKSSIIRTYEALDDCKSKGYLYISIMDFNNNNDYYGIDEDDNIGYVSTKDKEENLAKFNEYLLASILSRANTVLLPDSGYKLIPKKKSWKWIFLVISLVMLAASMFAAHFYDIFAPSAEVTEVQHYSNPEDTDSDDAVGLKLTDGEEGPAGSMLFSPTIKQIIYFIMGVSAVSTLAAALIYLKERIRIVELKLKSEKAELEAKEKDEKGYVDKQLFEMMYALENIADEIGHTVVFEDMDRLDKYVSTEIFAKLCRLSRLINNRHKGRIRFVYVFNDAILNNTKRNKFFDYVLLVEPFISRLNGGDRLKSYISNGINDNTQVEAALNDERVEKMWEHVGNCVYDMRVFNAITESFEVSLGAFLENGSLINVHTLPYVIYRILLPNDYHRAMSEESVFKKTKTVRDATIKRDLHGSHAYKEAVCQLIQYFNDSGLLNDALIFSLAGGFIDYRINKVSQDTIETVNTALKKTNDGTAAYEAEDYKKAEDQYYKALEDYNKHYSSSAPVVLNCIYKLGEIYESRLEYGTAINRYEDVIRQGHDNQYAVSFRLQALRGLVRSYSNTTELKDKNIISTLHKKREELVTLRKEWLGKNGYDYAKYLLVECFSYEKEDDKTSANNVLEEARNIIGSLNNELYNAEVNGSYPISCVTTDVAAQNMEKAFMYCEDKLKINYPDFRIIYTVFGSPCIGRGQAERLKENCNYYLTNIHANRNEFAFFLRGIAFYDKKKYGEGDREKNINTAIDEFEQAKRYNAAKSDEWLYLVTCIKLCEAYLDPSAKGTAYERICAIDNYIEAKAICKKDPIGYISQEKEVKKLEETILPLSTNQNEYDCYMKGMENFIDGKYGDAIKQLENISNEELQKSNPCLYVCACEKLGNAYIGKSSASESKKGEYDKALDWYNKALEVINAGNNKLPERLCNAVKKNKEEVLRCLS